MINQLIATLGMTVGSALLIWSAFLHLLGPSPHPRLHAWARGMLFVPRGVLNGLWRSLAPYSSKHPPFGRPRHAQGREGRFAVWTSDVGIHFGYRADPVREQIRELQKAFDAAKHDFRTIPIHIAEQSPHITSDVIPLYGRTPTGEVDSWAWCGRCHEKRVSFPDRDTCFDCQQVVFKKAMLNLSTPLVTTFSVPPPLLGCAACDGTGSYLGAGTCWVCERKP